MNGQVRDLSRAINDDATIQILTWDDKEGKATFWHSSAHLMAEAIEALYPGTKFGIGPPLIRDSITTSIRVIRLSGAEDLQRIEKKMQEMAQKKSDYIRTEMPKTKAVAYFTEKGSVQTRFAGGPGRWPNNLLPAGRFYRFVPWPHVPNTEIIKAVKQPIFPVPIGVVMKATSSSPGSMALLSETKDLDEYLLMLEEAKSEIIENW